jgi:hypothetical protein
MHHHLPRRGVAAAAGPAGPAPAPGRWQRRRRAAAARLAGRAASLDLAALDDVALAQQAHDWGYTQLGRPVPAGVSLNALAETLPPDTFQIDMKQAFGRLALALGLMAAGYWWLWYQHSICPLWQQLVCWVAIGTGYFSAFMTATDAAHFVLWPQEPGLQASGGPARGRPPRARPRVDADLLAALCRCGDAAAAGLRLAPGQTAGAGGVGVGCRTFWGRRSWRRGCGRWRRSACSTSTT